MQKFLYVTAGLALAILGPGPAGAQDTVSLAMINEYSGQFADTGAQIDHGVKLYMKQHGDTVAGKKIELIRKDTGGIAPDLAKRLAQEAIVRDHADILGGLLAHAECAGGSRRLRPGKEVHGRDERRHLGRSPPNRPISPAPRPPRRSSTSTLGTWAAKHGIKTIYTMVSDYGPGIDAEKWFQKCVKDGGGEIVGSVRFPVANPDFSAFVQARKRQEPGRHLYLDSRRRAAGSRRQGVGRARHRHIKIKILGQDALASETALKSMGDAAIGIIIGVRLRLQSSIADEPGIRQSL